MPYCLPQELPPGVSHPAAHLTKLLRLPEFSHLKDGEARIEFIMRSHEQIKAGRQILGTCHLPAVQGRLKDVFTWMLEEKFPGGVDFLIELDAQYWLDSGEREREILIYHELCHAEHAVDKHGTPRFTQEDGRPVWAIRGHDVEEFTAVVARYGAWSPDLKSFLAAVKPD